MAFTQIMSRLEGVSNIQNCQRSKYGNAKSMVVVLVTTLFIRPASRWAWVVAVYVNEKVRPLTVNDEGTGPVTVPGLLVARYAA